jgi:formate/nitrite transporter FocA (FNT family)
VGFEDPHGITEAATAAGAAKAELAPAKALAAGFMAGAFIALGGLVAVSASAGLDPKT